MLRDRVTNVITGETRTIPPGVIIREGLEIDYESVCKLCKELHFLEGCDFVPSLWIDDCKDPNRILVVAELEGQVVTINGFAATNNGRHSVGYAARCLPKYQRSNLFWACVVFMNQLVRERFPNIRKSLATTMHVDRFKQHEKTGDNEFRIKCSETIIIAFKDTALTTLYPALSHMQSLQSEYRSVREIQTKEQLVQIFNNKSLLKILFPTDYFMLDYVCYEVIPQSACDMWNPKRHRFVIEEGENKTFSICYQHAVTTGNFMIILFYGQLNLQSIICHLNCYFRDLKHWNNADDLITVMLTFASPYAVDEVINLFHKQLRLSDGGFGIRECIGLAKDIKVSAKY